MLKVLAWKEWREQRPVVYAGVILAAVMPMFLAAGLPLRGPYWDAITWIEMIPVALGIFVWPILAAAAGASTISNEAGDGTLGFLLSRPVSRTRLWLIKVSVALLSALTVAAISLAFAQICNAWVFQGRADASVGVLLRRASFGPFDLVALASLSLLLFACAVFFSTFLPRPLPAAAAGAALALLMLAGILLLWAFLSLTPRLEPQWLAAEVTLAALLILLASLIIFARAELLRQGTGWQFPALAAVVVVGLLGLVAIPAAHARGRFTKEAVVIPGDGIAVSTSGVALTVAEPGARGQEIWLVRADGSGTLPLTGRHTLKPIFSPSERSFLYFSKRDLFGAVLADFDLRATGTDGNGDRLIVPGLPSTGELYFSLYGRRALLVVEETLYVIALRGSEVVARDIGGPDLAGAVLAGWIDNLEDEVLFVRMEPTSQAGIEEMSLLAYGLENGATRTLFSSRVAPAGYVQPGQPESGWRFFPVPVAVGERFAPSRRIDLVDLEFGETTTLGESSCFSGEFSPWGGFLTYLLCAEAAGGSPVATVLTRNLERDEEKVIAELGLGGGSVTMVAARVVNWDNDVVWVLLEQELSPGGETIAVVLGPEGHRLGMLPGWKPVGLSGTARVLLVDNHEWIRTIASGDVHTGMLQVIYP